MKLMYLTLPAALLLCHACVPIREYSPQEVLERSVQAQQELQSARFDIHAIATGTAATLTQPLRVELFLNGTLAHRGSSIDAQAKLHVDTNETVAKTWQAEGAVIRAGNQTFIRVENTSGEIDFPLIQSIEPLKGTWYQLPADNAQHLPEVTPDPSLVSLQLQSVTVTKNYGIVERKGVKVYQFDAMLNTDVWNALKTEHQDAAVEATGSLFIDARTFHLRSAEWRVVRDSGSFPSTLNFTIEASHFNEHTSIVPPQNVTPLNLQMFIPVTLPQPTF